MVISVIQCLFSNTVELKDKIWKIKSQHTHTNNIRASLCSWVYQHDNISHICLFLPLHRCCCVHPLWLFSSLSFSSRPPSSSCPCQARCRRARPGHAERRSGPSSSSRPSGPESDGGTSHLAFVQANSIQIQKVNDILIIWVSHIWSHKHFRPSFIHTHTHTHTHKFQ